MRKLAVAFTLAIAVTALALTSFALARNGGSGSKHFRADLNGWKEIPSVVSTGEGTFRGTLVGNTIEYTLRYTNLETDALFSHIHIGGRHENGGVSVFLCGGGGKPSCPLRSGEVSGVIVPADVVGPVSQGVLAGEFDDLLLAMRRGEAYVNVHSQRSPGGEIRGQVRRGRGDDRD